MQERELPGQLIQSGAQAIRELSGEHSDLVGHRIKFTPDNVAMFLTIILIGYGVGVLGKSVDDAAKLLKMFLGPSHLHFQVEQAAGGVVEIHDVSKV